MQPLAGRTALFTGKIDDKGENRVTGAQTVCLVNVCDNSGKPLTDHAWIHLAKAFRRPKGYTIKFQATVQSYPKANSRDYGFTDVTLVDSYPPDNDKIVQLIETIIFAVPR